MVDTPFTEALSALPYRGEPLPRRHSLTREDVGASQRGRLLHAVLRVVAVKGYPATTIGDIVESASVSRHTFYQHFPSKEACFLAAYDDAVEVVRDWMAPAVDAVPSEDWRGTVHAALTSYLGLLSTEPAASRSIMIEAFAVGPACVSRAVDAVNLFADLFRAIHAAARKQEPDRPELSSGLFDVLVGGIIERVRLCLLTEGAESLPTLEPMFAEAVFAMFGDPPAAHSPGEGAG